MRAWTSRVSTSCWRFRRTRAADSRFALRLRMAQLHVTPNRPVAGCCMWRIIARGQVSLILTQVVGWDKCQGSCMQQIASCPCRVQGYTPLDAATLFLRDVRGVDVALECDRPPGLLRTLRELSTGVMLRDATSVPKNIRGCRKTHTRADQIRAGVSASQAHVYVWRGHLAFRPAMCNQ